MSHRVEQLERTLQKEIGRHLSAGLADPRVTGLVSVTGVELTEDRRTAVVHVSIMPEDHSKRTIQGLRHAARHIQAAVSKRIAVRQMPHLDFKLDRSLKNTARCPSCATACAMPTEFSAGP